MYASLWWKDTRQFWPIWVFLVLAAVLIQAMLIYFFGSEVRQGGLGLLALLYASLYSFAVGAAAFAGERETGTLRLLDTIPIDRRIVWNSKVSFALVTTLALTVVLLLIALGGTDHNQWNITPRGAFFSTIVLVSLGWGLACSATSSNALTAAVVAICATVVSQGIPLIRLDLYFGSRDFPMGLVLWQAIVFLTTLFASNVAFARSVSWRRFQLSFRSPIVVDRSDDAASGRVPHLSPVATVLLPRPASAPYTTVAAPPMPPRQSWASGARVLAWQTVKGGRRTWLLLAGILVAMGGISFTQSSYVDSIWFVMISIGLTLVAGANVFGSENIARTHRFLTHHGARPGLVWLIKMAVWIVGAAILGVPLAILLLFNARVAHTATDQAWVVGVAAILINFAIAQLGGMAMRRGITAVAVSMMLALVVLVPLWGLLAANMLPVWGMFVVPVGLLFVSWAWSGDWLFDRPAPGRWIRLGVLLTAVFALEFGWYAGYRAWSIADVGPIAPPALWTDSALSANAIQSVPITADGVPSEIERNAADLYREAGRRLVGPL